MGIWNEVVKVLSLWLSNTGTFVVVAVFNNDTVVLRGTVALLERSCEKAFCQAAQRWHFKWVFFAAEGLINDDRPGFSLIDPLSSSILSSISWNLKFRQCLGILKPDTMFSFSETLAKISFHL